MTQYFPKPFRNSGGNINLKAEMSNYATKLDLKEGTGVDTSIPSAKSDLLSLKAEVAEIDRDRLTTVSADLRN